MDATISISRGTTVGSARVEVSPNEEASPAAIFRKILRIIFPERV